MSETEQIRELLDKRGVDWHCWKGAENDITLVDSIKGSFMVLDRGKTIRLIRYFDTPQQAVEATFGLGECHAIYKPDGVVCSECGGSGLTVPRLGVKAFRNFCPNCGRKIVKC